MSPPHFGKVVAFELLRRIPGGNHSRLSAAPCRKQLQDSPVGCLPDLQKAFFVVAVVATLQLDVERIAAQNLLGFVPRYAVLDDVA